MIVTPKPHSMAVFFALAFGFTWIVWVPQALASHGYLSFTIDAALAGLFGAFGPCLAALITTALYDGRAGFRDLFRRLVTLRVGLQWYAFVLCWPAIVSLAKSGIAVALGSTPPDFSRPPFLTLYPLPPEVLEMTPWPAFLPFVFLQQTLLGSSMGEEPGWRGYALPRLQSQQSSLRASVLLGVVCSAWHLPQWLTEGHPVAQTPWGWTVLGLIAASVLFTCVFNHTRGSLFMAILFHTSIAVTGLFLASAEAHPAIEVILNWGLAAAVIAVCGAKRLSRDSVAD
jgi:membrane protease YdiL (CAAX protease family)